MLASAQNFFQMQYAGITVQNTGLALLAIIGGGVAAWLLTLLLRRLARSAEKAKTRHAEVLLAAVIKPAVWAVVLSGLWLGATLLAIPDEQVELHKFLNAFFRGGSILLLVWFGIRFSDGGCAAWAKKLAKAESKTDHRIMQVVRAVLRILLAVLGGTIFMQNLGYSVGSLLAGLGLGGAALALASKDLLSNVFGAVSIFWDRSFKVGDWVEIGEVEGNVEEVGLRNTKIRTFSNSLVTMPNSSLTTGTINNWTRMKKRRAQVRLHLPLATHPDKILALVVALRELLAQDENMVADDFVVSFDSIDEFSYCVFVQFFTRSVEWKEHLEAKQVFLLKAIEEMLRLGIEMASIPVMMRSQKAWEIRK